ncbi:hypothetical protein N7456_005794 [Penicillium angulare]|uniref:Uncharacterized protein n=1 Tax=Penicillium angulare TaxID=116970 RepID=A0A9W9FZ25_9EURO|nr:hypothetical protein N7456_005794 [Penicillium angulare]
MVNPELRRQVITVYKGQTHLRDEEQIRKGIARAEFVKKGRFIASGRKCFSQQRALFRDDWSLLFGFFVIHHLIMRAQLALPLAYIPSLTDADKTVNFQVLFEAVPDAETEI